MAKDLHSRVYPGAYFIDYHNPLSSWYRMFLNLTGGGNPWLSPRVLITAEILTLAAGETGGSLQG